jgi:hypothetical protein
MTTSKGTDSGTDSGTDASQIAEVEARLYERRSRVAVHFAAVVRDLRAGMTAPGTLLVAVGVGVVVEQGTHDRTWSLVPVLRGLSLARRLVVLLTSLIQSLDVASAS